MGTRRGPPRSTDTGSASEDCPRSGKSRVFERGVVRPGIQSVPEMTCAKIRPRSNRPTMCGARRGRIYQSRPPSRSARGRAATATEKVLNPVDYVISLKNTCRCIIVTKYLIYTRQLAFLIVSPHVNKLKSEYSPRGQRLVQSATLSV